MLISGKIVSRSCNTFHNILSRMSTSFEDSLLAAAKQLVPSLSDSKHKGQDGRIGVFGGSFEYTGAPFFAGMSALKTGADLVHIFCCKDASTSIKSYSPELMVHPVLDDTDAMNKIQPWLERLHVVLIGPGLGRDAKIFQTITILIETCRRLSKPLIIDADGLFLVGQNPSIVKDYPNLILTPNAMEYTRLVEAFLKKTIQATPIVEDSSIKELAEAIGEGVTVVRKGRVDAIADGTRGSSVWHCSSSGSGRRCGGQGDLLAGALATFGSWAASSRLERAGPVASYAACRLARECNAAAFELHARGALTTDMLALLPRTFAKLFDSPTN